jgi:hypothetical protein
MMRRILHPFWIALALIFLFEAWLWHRLEAIISRLVAAIGLPALKLRVAAAIERLPPAATLAVFLIPVLLLLPLKFLGLWLLARGSWLGAMAVIVLAKIISMGVTAFIFEITRPKLMQLAWFARFYGWVLTGLAWAHRQTDPIKQQIRAWADSTLAPVLRRVRSLGWLMKPQRGGRFLRRIVRIRRRMLRA